MHAQFPEETVREKWGMTDLVSLKSGKKEVGLEKWSSIPPSREEGEHATPSQGARPTDGIPSFQTDNPIFTFVIMLKYKTKQNKTK